jgi:hypothetical protein
MGNGHNAFNNSNVALDCWCSPVFDPRKVNNSQYIGETNRWAQRASGSTMPERGAEVPRIGFTDCAGKNAIRLEMRLFSPLALEWSASLRQIPRFSAPIPAVLAMQMHSRGASRHLLSLNSNLPQTYWAQSKAVDYGEVNQLCIFLLRPSTIRRAVRLCVESVWH